MINRPSRPPEEENSILTFLAKKTALPFYLFLAHHRARGSREREGKATVTLTQTLVHCPFLASLWFVGPAQTATLKYSMQPKEKREHSATQPASIPLSARRTGAA